MIFNAPEVNFRVSTPVGDKQTDVNVGVLQMLAATKWLAGELR